MVEDLRKEIKELSKKIERLEEAFEKIARPYSELLDYIEKFQGISRGYFRVMELYEKYGGISPEMAIPSLKDPISKEIVKILFDKGERNISQIAREMKIRRGASSRRIVRERLQKLEKEEIVVCNPGRKSKSYSISKEVIGKWSKVLGLLK